MVKSTRLVLGLVDAFQTKMKNSKDPRIEEVQIPRAMEKWAPSLTQLSGILIPGQEMVNFFTNELARGQKGVPAYTPFVTCDLTSEPWVPLGPASPRSHDQWKRLQTTHKRQTDQPMSFQLFTLNYIRFAFAGDLAGAWEEFGGLAAQWFHLGPLLGIATTENAMAAIAYGRSVRQTIMTNSRKRIPPDVQKK